MRQTLFRGAALAASVGVAVLVATGGQGCGSTTAPTAASADPSAASASASAASASAATASASAASAPVPAASVVPADDDGVIGPSTKADPHAIRRAVGGLVSGRPTPPPPPSAAPR